MSEVKKRNGKSDIREKLIAFAVMAGITVFFCGHLSAVIEKGADLDNWSTMLMEHLRVEPFDFFHVNYYVLYFAVCIFALIFFMAFSKRELPRAEMKGIEHGSNDFQSIEERNSFLENNTTPIYSLDLYEFAEKMVTVDKVEPETFDQKIFKWMSEKIKWRGKRKDTKWIRWRNKKEWESENEKHE